MDNYRQELIDKILNNEIKELGHNDTFKFSCNVCGKCCRNRDDIILNTFDIYRLAKFLSLTPYEFIEKYCDKYLGPDSKLPIVAMKFKTIYDLNKTYTACPFLKHRDGVLKCIVHEAKPTVCALFPLGRAIKIQDSELEVYYYEQDVCCGSKETTHTIKEWLDSYSISDSEEAFILFSDFTKKLYEIIDLRKLHDEKIISEKMMESFYFMLVNLMYLKYDTNKPFIEQYKENLNSICKMSSNIAEILRLNSTKA